MSQTASAYVVSPYYSCTVSYDSSGTNSKVVMTSQFGRKKTKIMIKKIILGNRKDK